MKLGELISGVPVSQLINYNEDIEISHLTLSSNDCQEGSLFFAIRGSSHDGANYISDVELKGTVAVVLTSNQSVCSSEHSSVKTVKVVENAIDLINSDNRKTVIVVAANIALFYPAVLCLILIFCVVAERSGSGIFPISVTIFRTSSRPWRRCWQTMRWTRRSRA